MTTATPTRSLTEHAQELLPKTEVTYHGQSGDEYAFTVTHDGTPHTPVFNGRTKAWRCDCDGFTPEQNECLHTELVKVWRQAQKEQDATPDETTPPPPSTNGNGAPPPPKSIPRAKRNDAPSPRHNGKSNAPTSAFPTPATGVSVWSKQIAEALLAPFPAEMVGWKAQATIRDGSKAMAVAYVDARAVADRLDETVGPENWSDGYSVLGEQTGSFGKEVVVACRLTVLGVTKEDVGVGEDAKSAYSDAFKRAAVKHGVSRYLYSLPKQWVAYDAQKKQLKETPQLPSWAMPN
jgi:hypothetical protein